MMNELGHVCELVRYPVKSMAGVVTESAFLGWHVETHHREPFLKNNAGVYGTVVQTGTIRVGEPVSLVLDARR